MSTIHFKEVNCKNCYKCIRNCPVKAISFKEEHAQVFEDACILCGRCLKSCPQNAKSVSSELETVKAFLDKKQKVYVSIAPSYAAAFNIKSEKHLYSIFRRLGFTHVEETAVGAQRVTIEYHKHLLKKQMPNIISSACPVIVSLIEKYYPELIPQVAPVVSPMIAHAKLMKDMFGPRIKVVFIGPCLAKKEDHKDSENDSLVDAVLTFEELNDWIIEEGLSFEDDPLELEEDGFHKLNSRFYPAPGGIIKSLGSTKKYDYKFLKFDGIERCMEALEEIKTGEIHDYFLEMNSCSGGCLGGPCMNSESGGYLKLREKLISYVSNSAALESSSIIYNDKLDLKKEFSDKSHFHKIPDQAAIEHILRKIGKYSKEDELNCGACGYQTCREKAIAVYNKTADLKMCLPYMRTRAESISNIIMSSTPNAIFALNEELCIQEINTSAAKLFNLNVNEVQNINAAEILNCSDFKTVLDTQKNVYNQKYFYENYNVTVEQNILYIKQHNTLLIIMKDVTVDELKKHQKDKVRQETVDIAQKVIEKQMRVAQEIASLLGETTAETKVALTKLKNTVQVEMGEE